MDNFDLRPEPRVFSWKSLFWNTLTVLVLLVTGIIAYVILSIYLNPQTPINPFPPQSLPTLFRTLTPTNTPIPLDATWTPTPSIQAIPSRTKAPTWTLLPQFVTPSTATPGLPGTQNSPFPTGTSALSITTTPASLNLAAADITYMASTLFFPDLNCDWAGVMGKVLASDGTPLPYMEILLGGTLDGRPINYEMLSGKSATFNQTLSNHPIASHDTVWIQLLDSTSSPLTDKIYFSTYSTCAQNLVMVIFTKAP